ncbi:MAG: hypothetical protein ABIR53_00025 [Paraperlucidibaca sp.]
MKALFLALGLSALAAPAMAAQYVATGDWAPTRQAACEQATALAALRADAPISNSSCICDKGDKRFSCLATVDVASPAALVAQVGAATLAKPASLSSAK